MPNSPIPQIALRIGGTKQRQGGFVPLVSAGVLAGNEGSNMDRATLVTENPSFIIKHAPEYVLYMLCDSSVTSFDISTAGVLTIALTIPRNLQLAQHRSPYDLLMQVYRQFQQTCMRQQNNGHYAFLPDTPDSEPFRALLQQWPVEPRRGDYVEMSPQGLAAIMCLPEDKMSAFFADSMYHELSAFKEVEIGTQCQAMMTPGLERLEVPRPHHYRVVQNGQDTSCTLTLPTDSFRSTLVSTPDMEYDTLEFQLQQLLDAPDGLCCNGRVRLMADRDEIQVTLKGRPKACELLLTIKPYSSFTDFSVDDEHHVMQMLDTGELILKVAGRNMVEFRREAGRYLVPVSLMGSDQKMEVTPSNMGDYIFLLAKSRSEDGQATLTLSVGRKQKPRAAAISADDVNGERSQRSIGSMLGDDDSIAQIEMKRRQRRQRMIIIGAVAAVLLLLLGIALLLMNRQTKHSDITEEMVPEMVQHDIDARARQMADSIARVAIDSARQADSVLATGQAAAEEARAAADKAQQEADRIADEAKQKADAAQQQKADAAEKARQQKAQQRAAILQRVNNMNFDGIQQDPAWKSLTKAEQRAVETLFYGFDGKAYSPTQRTLVKNKQRGYGVFGSLTQVEGFAQQIKQDIEL